MERLKRTVSLLLAVVIIGAFCQVPATASGEETIEEIIEQIIAWKKTDVGAEPNGSLFNDSMLSLAGTTAGDWYPIGIGRYGYPENYLSYLASVTAYIETRYATPEKLSRNKATEWHRIALAIRAVGGDPTRAGTWNGEPIDLIADGTYYRGLTVSPGKQGINGWIWGLIALDSGRYEVPDGAFHTRADFIVEILRAQLPDGGFALAGNTSDPDITAMALQALSPYYNTSTVYTYTSSKIRDEDGNFSAVGKTVREVVDESLAFLSSAQRADGDFASWGTVNAESTCQVLIALTALGIDALHDGRFIKNGNTLLDGILKYRLQNGGFVHSSTYDPNNPTALPYQANSMATEQALCALVSLWRYRNGMRTLYDMREEFTDAERGRIDNCVSAIDTLTEEPTGAEVDAVIALFEEIPPLDRCYVTNYRRLQELSGRVNARLPEEPPSYSGQSGEEDSVLLWFSQEDRDAADSLPPDAELTTAYYPTVVTLRYLLANCEDFEDKQTYIAKIEKAFNRITEIQREMKSLEADILAYLYPFDRIGLSDRKTVHALYDRYTALSEYDRAQLGASDVEGLLKSKTQVDNLYRAVRIAAVSAAAVLAMAAGIVLHVRKRRKKKRASALPESEE